MGVGNYALRSIFPTELLRVVRANGGPKTDEVAQDRAAALGRALVEAIMASYILGMEPGRGGSSAVDSNATVLVTGKLTQVLLREWVDDLYIGITHSDALDGFEHYLASVPSSQVANVVSRMWAHLDVDSSDFATYRGPATPHSIESCNGSSWVHAANRAITLAKMRYPETAGFFRKKLRCMVQIVGDMARVAEFSKSLETVGNFSLEFGITPSEYLRIQGEVDGMAVFMSEFGGTPEMVHAAYRQELKALQEAVLNTLAAEGEAVCRPKGAWDFDEVNLSEFRIAAAVQLNKNGVKLALQGHANFAIRVAMDFGKKPYVVSLMPEMVFDKTVSYDIKRRYPVQQASFYDGVYTLYTSPDSEDGVVVYRGHPSWGCFETPEGSLESAKSRWAMVSGCVRRDEIPSWLHFPEGQDAALTIGEISVPGSIQKALYGVDGSLRVKGLAIESRAGHVASLYVSFDARPDEPSALYGVVKADGDWIEPLGQCPVHVLELSHG